MRIRLGGTRTVLLVLAVGLAVLLGWRMAVLTAEEEPEPTVDEIRQERGVPVRVAEASEGPLEVWRRFTGTVTGDHEGVVRSRSDDPVKEITVSEGERVEEGRVLIRQGGQASDARVRQAEAALRQAERRVERLRPLWEAGALSDQDWEDARTQLEVAEADLEQARDVVELLSPVAGVVTEIPAREGMIPAAGDPLVRVVDVSVLVSSHRVTSSDADELERGMLARVAGRGDAPPAIQGAVRRVPLQADPVSRLVEVEVEFPADAPLRPGSFASVEIRTARADDVVRIPRDALRDEGVWVVDDEERAVLREVEVGLRARDAVEVLAGIEAGERVVVEGASLLSDGARARVVE